MFRRDGYRCVYCGVIAPSEDLTVDHVEPRMRGGDESEGNLVTCCKPCNTLKGAAPAWSYLSKNAQLREHFLASVAASGAGADGAAAGAAQPVWPRLIRAIVEAARKANTKS